jgi:hypothetical protein
MGARRIRRVGTAVAVVLVAALVPASALAHKRFASSAGANSGNCAAPDTPCSLARAVQTVSQDGDEVIVEPGSYTSQSIDQAKRLYVHGKKGSPAPVIKGTTDPWEIASGADGSRLSGLHIELTTGPGTALFTGVPATFDHLELVANGGTTSTPADVRAFLATAPATIEHSTVNVNSNASGSARHTVEAEAGKLKLQDVTILRQGGSTAALASTATGKVDGTGLFVSTDGANGVVLLGAGGDRLRKSEVDKAATLANQDGIYATAARVTLDRVDVTAGVSGGAAAVELHGNHAIVDRSTIDGNAGSGYGLALFGDQAVVRRSYLEGGSAGLRLNGSDPRASVFDTVAWAISGGNGVVSEGHLKLRGVTAVAQNGMTLGNAGLQTVADGKIDARNVIAIGTTDLANVGQEIKIAYSDYDTKTNSIVNGGHNIHGDCQLRNPGNGEFHIHQPSSPCIDAGASYGSTGDFEGDPRPRGPAFDIGADEFNG